jgi:hypothetical protein
LRNQILLLAFLLIIGKPIALAQAQLTIHGDPKTQYGFLTWTNENPAAAYHLLNVQQLQVVNGDTSFVVLYRNEVWGKNYVKIPDAYVRNYGVEHPYQVTLTPHKANNEPISEDMYSSTGGGDGGVPGCFWECVSNQWAFRIQQYELNSQFNYRIEMAKEVVDEELNMEVPYYMHFTPIDFNNYVGLGSGSGSGSGNPNYHNWSDWAFLTFYYINPNLTAPGYAYMQFSQTPPYYMGYCDELGHEITTPIVHGIRKGFGPYWSPETGSTLMVNGLTANYCEANLGANLISMMQFMSQQLDLDVALDCPLLMEGGSCINFGGGSGDGGSPDDGIDDIKDLVSAYKRYIMIGSGLVGSGGGVLDEEIILVDGNNWLTMVTDIFANDVSGSEGEKFAALLTDVEHFSIMSHNEGSRVMVQGHNASFFDHTGSPVFPVLNFEPGLYSLHVRKEDSRMFYIYFEVVSSFVSELSLKYFFDALVYPNPHSGPAISAELSTTAALDVRYDLLDAQGNILFTKHFQVPKDHNGHHQITPETYVADGLLYHKFSFNDGSFKTYISLKQ